MAKICSVAAIALLVVAALGPANWAPRTALGWQIDHFLGYFVITSIVCIAWSRPFVVGSALMAGAVLLEGLQALTPDRSPNLFAAFCGASGVLAAALLGALHPSTQCGAPARRKLRDFLARAFFNSIARSPNFRQPRFIPVARSSWPSSASIA